MDRRFIPGNDMQAAISLTLSSAIVNGLLTFIVSKAAGIQEAGFRGMNAGFAGLFGGALLCAGKMFIETGDLADFSNWPRNKKFLFFLAAFVHARFYQAQGIEVENLPPVTNLFGAGFNLMRFGLVVVVIIPTLLAMREDISELVLWLTSDMFEECQPPIKRHEYKNAELLEALETNALLSWAGYRTPEALPHFICNISFLVMDHPVSTSPSSSSVVYTFEKDDIESWLKIKQENPITRDYLTKNSLRPNDALEEEIKLWLKKKCVEKITAYIRLKLSTLSEEQKNQLKNQLTAIYFSPIPPDSQKKITFQNPTALISNSIFTPNSRNNTAPRHENNRYTPTLK